MKYQVSVDVIMNKYIEVEANSDEEAVNKVNDMFANNPYDYTNNFSHYVGHEVISAEEIEPEPEPVRVRIKFSADIAIKAENLAEAKRKWENMPLWSEEALNSGADFCEELLIEDAETYDDLQQKWHNS